MVDEEDIDRASVVATDGGSDHEMEDEDDEMESETLFQFDPSSEDDKENKKPSENQSSSKEEKTE